MAVVDEVEVVTRGAANVVVEVVIMVTAVVVRTRVGVATRLTPSR